jgi:hypothetical protein
LKSKEPKHIHIHIEWVFFAYTILVAMVTSAFVAAKKQKVLLILMAFWIVVSFFMLSIGFELTNENSTISDFGIGSCVWAFVFTIVTLLNIPADFVAATIGRVSINYIFTEKSIKKLLL